MYEPFKGTSGPFIKNLFKGRTEWWAMGQRLKALQEASRQLKAINMLGRDIDRNRRDRQQLEDEGR